MKKIQAQNYVMENARYMPDAPQNACYFVRFPKPTSTKNIFSGDTRELVEKVYQFAKTIDGRRLCRDVDFSEYDILIESEEDADE